MLVSRGGHAFQRLLGACTGRLEDCRCEAGRELR
jgi:hypothetical protein